TGSWRYEASARNAGTWSKTDMGCSRRNQVDSADRLAALRQIALANFLAPVAAGCGDCGLAGAAGRSGGRLGGGPARGRLADRGGVLRLLDGDHLLHGLDGLADRLLGEGGHAALERMVVAVERRALPEDVLEGVADQLAVALARDALEDLLAGGRDARLLLLDLALVAELGAGFLQRVARHEPGLAQLVRVERLRLGGRGGVVGRLQHAGEVVERLEPVLLDQAGEPAVLVERRLVLEPVPDRGVEEGLAPLELLLVAR